MDRSSSWRASILTYCQPQHCISRWMANSLPLLRSTRPIFCHVSALSEVKNALHSSIDTSRTRMVGISITPHLLPAAGAACFEPSRRRCRMLYRWLWHNCCGITNCCVVPTWNAERERDPPFQNPGNPVFRSRRSPDLRTTSFSLWESPAPACPGPIGSKRQTPDTAKSYPGPLFY